MVKFIATQQKFNGGEISQALQNRFDLALYQNSCEKIENFRPQKEGGLNYRNGTYYLATVKDSNFCRLIDFIPNLTNVYILEFTDSFLRIYVDGNSTPITTLASPYKTADLPNIQTAQSGDIMYLVDGSKTIYKLSRTSTTSFTLAAAVMETATASPFTPPFLAENLSTTTLAASATTGNITLTASASLFTLNDVGRYLKIRDAGSGNTGYVKITAYTSATVVSATVKATLPGTSAYITWTLSATPSGVAFYQSRLFICDENALWGSRIYDDDSIPRYEDFTIGTTATFAFKFVSGLFRTPLLWLNSNDKTLLAGSALGIFLLDALDASNPLSPTSLPDIQKISSDGTKQITPIQKDNILFYVNRNGRRVESVIYSFQTGGFEVKNNNILSSDITRYGVDQLALEEGYNTIAYGIKSNGDLIGVNYDISQQLNGWFKDTTDGLIESVCVLPRSNNYDRVYIVVKRTINGVTKRYIEYYTDDVILPQVIDYYTGENNEETDEENFDIATYEAMKDFNFLDCSLTYDGSSHAMTMTPAAVTGFNVTFTAGASLFSSGDVGREIWKKNTKSRARIISYTSATQAQCEILEDFASTSAIAAGNWYLTTDSISGLSHLEGKEVAVIADGGYDNNSYTVSSGAITIVNQSSKVTVGLPYTGKVKLLNIEGGSMNGSSRIKIKQINKAGLFVYNSVGGKIGTDLYDLGQIYNGPSELMGYPIKPFTGIKDLSISDDKNTQKNIFLLQDIPQPCNIQLMTSICDTIDPD